MRNKEKRRIYMREYSRKYYEKRKKSLRAGKYKNVYWDKANNVYKVQFGIQGKDICFGRYKLFKDAKWCADLWRKKIKVRSPGHPLIY